MKTQLSMLAATLFVGLAAPVLAADKMEHMDHGSMHVATANTVLTDGLVKKIDKVNGKLTVAHGPLPNGMPGMTMAFRVKDSAWLGKVRESQKIRFAIDEEMTIVRLEPAK
jgi:Cu/Ag efflux protein CusF